MNGKEKLLKCEGRWLTDMGGFVLQERAFLRGKDLHAELGELSWLEIYLFGITGRYFDEVEIKVLNAIWVFTSYPDPRIWNNRVAALGGTVRSTGALSISAAMAVSEAEIFGGQPLTRAIRFLMKAQKRIENGENPVDIILNEIAKNKIIAGYGRPKATLDERIKPMLGFLERVRFPQGKHLRLAFKVEQILAGVGKTVQINYGAMVAAICADLGFSPRELNLFIVPLFLAGFPPCYLDALGHSEGCLFPLRCERIDYLGPEKRAWE